MDDLQLRTQRQVTRLGLLLPPEVAAASQQVASRVKGRLPSLVAVPGLEVTLRREVEREFGLYPLQFRVGPAIIAATLMVIAAVIILLDQIIAKGKQDKAAAKDEAKNKQLDATKSKLQKVLADLLSDVESQRNQPFTPGRRD